MKQLRMMDEHMARVPKQHFGEPQSLPYDVFVRLGSDHFVLVGRTGTASTIHRLKAFEADLVPWFYILRGDFPKYVDQKVARATILGNASSETPVLLEAVGTAMSSVLELVRVGGVSSSAWKATEKLSEIVLEAALARPSMATLMSNIQRLGEAQVRHAVAVAMVALMVARETGASTEVLRHLAAAGLLHDLGWLKLPADLLTKREDRLDPEERRIYETHPTEGANLLRECSQVPLEVVNLVYEHHENGVGSGFPRRLAPEKVGTPSLVLAMAERFCELTIGDGMHQDFLSPQAAINTIANVEGRPYPMELLKIVERLTRTSGPLKGN